MNPSKGLFFLERGLYMVKSHIVLQKIYSISQKAGQPRLFIQNLPCECASFAPGEEIYIWVDEQEKQIHLQNKPFEGRDEERVHVSSRTNATGIRRPLIDTAKRTFQSIIAIEDKVELLVYRFEDFSRITISPLKFKFDSMEVTSSLKDQRIRLLSISAGAGIGTSHFKDTGYYTPVQEIELEEDSADTLHQNFPNSLVSNCDIRDCNLAVQSDVALVTLPCNNHSSLGSRTEDMFDNLGIAAAKILIHSKPQIIFFENVPSYFNSRSFTDLKDLLSTDFPCWTKPINLESYDFGSIAKRDRSYVVAFKDEDLMMQFRFPSPPKKVKRPKLKSFLEKVEDQVWKPIDLWNASFKAKKEKNNAWADRSTELTFVDEEATLIQCVPKRYRSQSASNSYVLSTDKKSWRFLTVNELRKIFSISSWFKFSKSTPLLRVYEQIGQSACGLVFRAFANEIARILSKSTLRKGPDKSIMEIDQYGQLTMTLF